MGEEESEWQANLFSGPGDYLRNRLLAVMGFVQLAAEEVKSEDLTESLRLFKGFRAHYIERESLLISLQEKRLQERFPWSIRSIWGGVEEILKPELLSGVKCKIAKPEEKFSFDPKQMAWAVAELVRNGVEAIKGKKFVAEEQGMISVVFALEKESLRISVADNGRGMDEKVSEGLSNPQVRKFNRGALKGKVFTGPGFGLAIARRAVDNHKGNVVFKTREGEGSIFTITLPR